MTKEKKALLLRSLVLLPVIAALLMAFFLLERQSARPQATTPTGYTLPQSPFSMEDFSYQGDYLACLTAPAALGIDVSHHQGQIDWQQVADSGITFAMVRLGYRGLVEGALGKDDYAQQNLAGARAAGLKVGAYFYSQAVSVEEARQEAAYALELLGDFRLDLPLVFDWEIEARTQAVDPETASACAIAFCDAVAAAGWEPMVYFNGYQAQERMDMEVLERYPWWLAQYDLTAPFPCRMDMWQYTNAGTVPGIQGAVDVNLWFE